MSGHIRIVDENDRILERFNKQIAEMHDRSDLRRRQWINRRNNMPDPVSLEVPVDPDLKDLINSRTLSLEAACLVQLLRNAKPQEENSEDVTVT